MIICIIVGIDPSIMATALADDVPCDSEDLENDEDLLVGQLCAVYTCL